MTCGCCADRRRRHLLAHLLRHCIRDRTVLFIVILFVAAELVLFVLAAFTDTFE